MSDKECLCIAAISVRDIHSIIIKFVITGCRFHVRPLRVVWPDAASPWYMRSACLRPGSRAPFKIMKIELGGGKDYKYDL